MGMIGAHKNSYDYNLRKIVIKTLKKIGCKLAEIPHTKNVSSSIIYDRIKFLNVDPASRANMLRRVFGNKKLLQNY